MRAAAQVVVALERLNRIRAVDAANDSLIAEAGCRLAQVQAAAEAAGRFFPLSLGSEGSCQIGGNLSTNAGGTNVLRYGMMRDLVLGLEVVLADGRVLEGLSGLRKDNTGYDVKALFLGAEGTLGIITAASLRLFPRQLAHATALIAVPDVPAAVALLARVRAASSERTSSFELVPRGALELTVRHIPGVSDPFAKPYPWYVLCELSASRAAEPLAELLAEVLGSALEAGEVLDAVIAASERERLALWKMRENIPEAQRREGVGLKHDISVPVSCLRAVRGARRRLDRQPRCPTGSSSPTGTRAMATCTSISARSRAPTRSTSSRAARPYGASCTTWCASAAAASAPSTASDASRWRSSSATPPRSSWP